MATRIGLLSFATPNDADVGAAHQKLHDFLRESGVKAKGFDSYDKPKQFLLRLSDLFDESESVVIGVEPELYVPVKNLLLKSLGLRSKKSEEIIQACRNAGLSRSYAEEQSIVPKASTVFLTKDGTLSSFAAEAGPQSIIVVPLDLDKIYEARQSGLYDYISEKINANQSAREKDEEIVDGNSAIAPEQAYESINEAIDALKKAEMKVALASSKSTPFIAAALEKTDYSDCLVFAEPEIEQVSLPRKEQVAYLAKSAMEKMGAQQGAAISGVYSAEDGSVDYFIYVSVANSEKAKVIRAFCKQGETPRDLMVCAVDILFKAITDYAKNGFSVDIDKNSEEMKTVFEALKNKKKVAMLAASAVVALVLVLSTIIVVYALKGNSPGPSEETGGSETGTSSNSAMVGQEFLDGETGLIFDSPDSPIETAPPSKSSTTGNTAAPGSTGSTASGVLSSVKTTLESGPGWQVTTVPPAASSSQTEKNTSTTKPHSTTSTTRVPSSQTTTQSPVSKSGTFVFKTYGYGHGVGMSQRGAMIYSDQGWKYDKILLHYYYHSGVSLKVDSNTPKTVKYGGQTIDLVTYMCRTIKQEMGYSAAGHEALKAQAVAVYTFAKNKNFNVPSNQHAYNSSFAYSGTKIHKAVMAVLGMSSESDTPKAEYLDYDGKAILSVYFAYCEGHTVSSASVWGGSQSQYPYLAGGRKSPENFEEVTAKLTSAQFKTLVDEYNEGKSADKKIVLPQNPKDWISVVEHDKVVSGSVGYASKVKVGNLVFSGNSFRGTLLQYKIRSHCFDLEYVPD